MVTIIDYKLGNIASIANMLSRMNIDNLITSDVDIIENANKLILPGVGAFDQGMRNLTDLGLLDVLNKHVLKHGIPILGICLGMQLMTKKSEEGFLSGLSWFDAETVKFKPEKSNDANIKVPHMGWNEVKPISKKELFENIYSEPRFYFVHSYHVVCNRASDIVAMTFYGYSFTSAIAKENIIGVQFHPEKSHKFGMTFLRNWALS